MHRRAMLLTVAAAGIAVPLSFNRRAFAQYTGTGGTGTGSATSASLSGMDEDELKAMAAANSMASLQSSELAAKQASNDMVRQFAELEAEEQENTIAAMKAMGESPSDASIPADKKAMMQKLQSAQGAEFDEMFVTSQITAHQELLNLHQQLLQTSGRDSEGAVIPLLAVPAIKSHLVMLQMIQQDLGGQTATSR